MICRILHLQSEQEWVKASQWLDGRFNPGDSVEGSVREILANVREKGDEALIPPFRLSRICRAPARQRAGHRLGRRFHLSRTSRADQRSRPQHPHLP